jgi:hypothetical protein
MNLESLIILEYLNHGLVPYFPNKKTQPLGEIIEKFSAGLTKRKFRKVYKKAIRKLCPDSNLGWYGLKCQDPTPKQLMHRKKLVYRYLKICVIEKYGSQINS